MVDKLIDKMLDEYTQCQHCHYFTMDVPDNVYRPPAFREGVHGACIGCPNSPTHIEHKESTRCAWFSLRDDLRKECEMTPDEYAADATALDHADDAEMDNEQGLYCKYHITHADGTELSPGFLFVLRPDRDPAAWDALRAYALSTKNVSLGGDLWDWLQANPRPGTLLCQECGARATWEFWYIDHEARRQRFCDEHIGEMVNNAVKRYEHCRIEEPPEVTP